jgi:preprotein translocase subunit SecA
MFKNLLKEINKQIVNTIFHISVNVQPNNQVPILNRNLQTNLSSGSADQQSSKSSSNPTGDPKFDGIGRNDPCPCGSGKKFKKCHGKNN